MTRMLPPGGGQRRRWQQRHQFSGSSCKHDFMVCTTTDRHMWHVCHMNTVMLFEAVTQLQYCDNNGAQTSYFEWQIVSGPGDGGCWCSWTEALHSHQPNTHYCKLTAYIAWLFFFFTFIIWHYDWTSQPKIKICVKILTCLHHLDWLFVVALLECICVQIWSWNKLFLISITTGLLSCIILQLHRGATPPCLWSNQKSPACDSGLYIGDMWWL